MQATSWKDRLKLIFVRARFKNYAEERLRRVCAQHIRHSFYRETKPHQKLAQLSAGLYVLNKAEYELLLKEQKDKFRFQWYLKKAPDRFLEMHPESPAPLEAKETFDRTLANALNDLNNSAMQPFLNDEEARQWIHKGQSAYKMLYKAFKHMPPQDVGNEGQNTLKLPFKNPDLS